MKFKWYFSIDDVVQVLTDSANVGYERMEETENPELAARRMREIYLRQPTSMKSGGSNEPRQGRNHHD